MSEAKKLFEHCESGNLEELQNNFKPEYIDILDENGQTLLMIACQNGHRNIINYLLTHLQSSSNISSIEKSLEIVKQNGLMDVYDSLSNFMQKLGISGSSFRFKSLERRSEFRRKEDLINNDNVKILVIRNNKEILIVEKTTSLFYLEKPPSAVDLKVFLGKLKDHLYFGVLVSEDFKLPEHSEFVPFKPFVFTLNPFESNLIAQARSLLDWHFRYRYCPYCGQKMNLLENGWKRSCPENSNDKCLGLVSIENFNFPRTDPVVIGFVYKRIQNQMMTLLGRKPEFPKGLYSCLAGYMEPGETMEQAFYREVLEESGVQIDINSVEYYKSQPWPFPSQLMIGFFAEAKTEEINMIDDELEDARWFTIEELYKATQKESVVYKVPEEQAIARDLMDEFLRRHYLLNLNKEKE